MVYSYAAENPDELSLQVGDIIAVLERQLEDVGWWRGEVHGRTGVFPDNFVELIPPTQVTNLFPDKFSPADSNNGGDETFPG